MLTERLTVLFTLRLGCPRRSVISVVGSTSMADLFAQLVDEAFGFLVQDHGFSRKDTDEPLNRTTEAMPVARRIEFESKAIRVAVCWHRYDELGMVIWVLGDTFWIRPADPSAGRRFSSRTGTGSSFTATSTGPSMSTFATEAGKLFSRWERQCN